MVKPIEWRQIAEIVGIAALVASLIFVGLEIRQNTIAARASTYLAYGEHISNQFQATAHDESLAALTVVDESEWDQLTKADRARLVYMWIGVFRNYETILLQVEEGLLDEDAMERLGWGSAFNPTYQVKLLWPEISQWISPRVRAHIESNYPSLKGESTEVVE